MRPATDGGGWARRDPRWREVITDRVSLGSTRVRLLRHRDPGPGTPRLLVHGLGGAATNWLDVIDPLGRSGPVAAVDLPGFGHTRPPSLRAAHMGAQARFLPALCARLGWHRVVIHGASMGALVSVLTAADRPELVAGLVLVGPALPPPSVGLSQVPLRTVLRLAPFAVPGLARGLSTAGWRLFAPEQLYRVGLRVYAHPERLRASVREVALDNYRDGKRLAWRPPAFGVSARSLVSHLVGRRVRRAVQALQPPVLLLRGEADPLVPGTLIEALRTRRPDWGAAELAAAGHVAMVESPGTYAEAAGELLG